MCSYFNHVQQRYIRQTLCNVLLPKMIERQTKLNTNSFNLRCLTNLELKCCRRVAAVILLVELCNDDWRRLVPQLFESEQIYKFVFSHYIQARKQEIKWGVFFVKSGKSVFFVQKWTMGVFVKKWTFPQRRVHYVQYQYFLFYISLIWGGGAYAPNAPPAYGPDVVRSLRWQRGITRIRPPHAALICAVQQSIGIICPACWDRQTYRRTDTRKRRTDARKMHRPSPHTTRQCQ